MKKYDVMIIAKWFINETNPCPLKLQKLLYFSQGISFCMNDCELFSDDLEAWVHGPVVPRIYHEFKHYNHNPIDIEYNISINDKEVLEVLNYVKDTYNKYDAKYLEEMTHKQMPWTYARQGLDPDENSQKIIPKSIINDYFISSMFQPKIGEWQ